MSTDKEPLASVAADGTVQRDPLIRIARAMELYAVTGTFRAVAPSEVRERAWRAMLALIQEIEGDVAGPHALPPDLTPLLPPGSRHCCAGWRGLVCTRLPGHTGRHAAGDGQHIVGVWADPE